jgi:hypothetical protein
MAEALLATGVANLATLIPSSPGYVGPFESGVVLVVDGALGLPRSLALSYAIVVHAALYFPITILGVVEWWRQHLSVGQIRALESDTDATDDGGRVGARGGDASVAATVRRATVRPGPPADRQG